MGSLVKEALYSNRDEHYIRACRDNPGPCDITDYDGMWDRAAERVRTNDPDGSRAAALMRSILGN